MKQFTHAFSRSVYFAAGAAVLLAAVTIWAFNAPSRAHAATYSPLTQQMGVGASGAQVSELQSFLSLSHDIYPAGITSGFFGPLTSGAVTQFQVYYNLPAVGRVGPLTLSKLNSVIAAGNGPDVNAPIISNVSVSQSNTSATITWFTSEASSSRVYYDINPLSISEATANFVAPGISGLTVGNDSMVQSHSVFISGLQPNTIYNYTVRSIDPSGNVSMVWPTFFRTTN